MEKVKVKPSSAVILTCKYCILVWSELQNVGFQPPLLIHELSHRGGAAFLLSSAVGSSVCVACPGDAAVHLCLMSVRCL